MNQVIEVAGGEHAPLAGRYVEINVFGTPTGRSIAARAGEKLPPVLQGHAWRLAEREPAPD